MNTEAATQTPGQRRAAAKSRPIVLAKKNTQASRALKREALVATRIGLTKDERAQLDASRARTAKEEADAKQENDRVLATVTKKAKAKPELKIGSGAAVGVAQGAMDGQPHTKRAVEEARKKYAALNPTRAADAKLIAAQPVKVKETKVKAPRPKAEPKPKAAPAVRSYSKGPTDYTGKPGSWTAFMVAHALKHKDTAKATAAYEKLADYTANNKKPLDFRWMDAKGYIKFG